MNLDEIIQSAEERGECAEAKDAFAGSLENREVYFFAAWNGGMPGAEAAALRMWDEAEKLGHSVDWGITIENGCVIEISKKPTVEE